LEDFPDIGGFDEVLLLTPHYAMKFINENY